MKIKKKLLAILFYCVFFKQEKVFSQNNGADMGAGSATFCSVLSKDYYAQAISLKKVSEACQSDDQSYLNFLTSEESNEDKELQELKNKYINSEEVRKFILSLRRNALTESAGQCLKYIKNALVSSGLTKTRMKGFYALSALEEMKCHGFINLLDYTSQHKKYLNHEDEYGLRINEYDAMKSPPGAILIYKSGIPCKGKESVTDCGHIEAPFYNQIGLKGYVSDHISKNGLPITHKKQVQINASDRLLFAIKNIRKLIPTALQNISREKMKNQEARYVLVGVMIKGDLNNTKYQATCKNKNGDVNDNEED